MSIVSVKSRARLVCAAAIALTATCGAQVLSEANQVQRELGAAVAYHRTHRMVDAVMTEATLRDGSRRLYLRSAQEDQGREMFLRDAREADARLWTKLADLRDHAVPDVGLTARLDELDRLLGGWSADDVAADRTAADEERLGAARRVASDIVALEDDRIARSPALLRNAALAIGFWTIATCLSAMLAGFSLGRLTAVTRGAARKTSAPPDRPVRSGMKRLERRGTGFTLDLGDGEEALDRLFKRKGTS